MTLVLFFYFSAVIVTTAILVIALRRPIYSALSLFVMFFHVAGLFVLLDAEFIAAVQVIVYAGAILVLYLFVVMILNVRTEENYHRQVRIGAGVAGILLVEILVLVLRSGFSGEAVQHTAPALAGPGAVSPGNTEVIGQLLFTAYLFPFEVASLILLAAMIGAIIFTKKGIFGRESGPRR